MDWLIPFISSCNNCTKVHKSRVAVFSMIVLCINDTVCYNRYLYKTIDYVRMMVDYSRSNTDTGLYINQKQLYSTFVMNSIFLSIYRDLFFYKNGV